MTQNKDVEIFEEIKRLSLVEGSIFESNGDTYKVVISPECSAQRTKKRIPIQAEYLEGNMPSIY